MPGKFKAPNTKVSAVSKSTLSTTATNRLSKNATVTLPTLPTVVGATATVNLGPVTLSKQKMPSRGETLKIRTAKQRPAAGCSFNLPPHAWSLPVRPVDVIGPEHIYSNANTPLDAVHKYRRGAIWFYDTGAGISVTDDEGNVSTAGANKDAGLTEAQKTAAANKAASSDGESTDFNYGFQFLWNPEQISVAVARNMDVTPSSSDRLRSVSGAFPGQENVQFTIVLDRVNDFAALKGVAGVKKSEKGAFPSFSEKFVNQYKYGMSDSASLGRIPMNQKLYELSRYGTLADLEYLFKAINGAGPGTGWVTLLGKKTADIGFLSPTLLAFRFGPDSQESLSFVGWITNLSINHTMFTEEMVPLRTTVNVSVDCFAGSSIV